MCFLYTKQSVQTTIKLILKWWVLYFTEKSNLEKKLGFPKNSKFFEIHNFHQNAPKLVTPRRKFPGIWAPQGPKMQEYTGFPEFMRQNSEFSPKSFTKIFSFHENPGSTFSRIPGNFGRHNPEKCRNIWVSRNSRAEI